MSLPLADEVHVWLQHVDVPRTELSAIAHDRLRMVLGGCLDLPPDALDFETGPYGKPFLKGDTPLRFNLSHSGGLVAIAVARDREVGVDVQEHRAVHAEAGVARRIMSDAEHARYAALPDDGRTAFLLWVWARKEALVKAAGTGIRASLQDVSCEPGPDGRFRVVDLDVPGYAAAVAAAGHDWRTVVQERGPTG